MKKLYLILLTMSFLFSLNSIYSQSISFSSPHNGETVTGAASGSTETTIPVSFQYGYTLTTYPQAVGMYVKLITHNNTYNSDDGGIPQWFNLTPGTYTWKLELYEIFPGVTYGQKTASTTITFYVKHTLTIKNNFNDGDIYIDGSKKNSGTKVYKFINNTISLGAIDQPDNGTQYVWKSSGNGQSYWKRKPKSKSYFTDIHQAYTRNYTYTVANNDNGAVIQADMKKELQVGFSNYHSGGEVGGPITINGTTYTSPKSNLEAIEDDNILAKAVDHELNGIKFTFDKWVPTNSTSREKTFTVTSNTNYEAKFIGRPTNAYRNQQFAPKVVGNHIEIKWKQHPSSKVSMYKIYRKTKYSPEVCVATISRSGSSSKTYSWTDPTYVYTNNTSSTNLLSYDVRAYYEPDQTLSDYDWRSVYGEENIEVNNEQHSAEGEMIVDNEQFEYSISNYPNPYNPTTTINYSIKEQGNVNIVVYDALGRKVKELVNEVKQPGSYKVSFDGSNLSSGIYFYTMSVNNYTASKKMILTK